MASENNIHAAVQTMCTRWKDSLKCPPTLLPIRLDDRRTELDTAIAEWIGPGPVAQNYSPTVALLTGSLGGGKTTATCQLPALLRHAWNNSGTVLWLPCRDLNLYDAMPERAITALL